RELRHMIRLDRGRFAVGRLMEDLMLSKFRQHNANAERDEEQVSFASILAIEEARPIVEFFVDHIPVGEGDSIGVRLVWVRDKAAPEQADKLFQRIINANPKDPDHLGNYALFLKNQRGDLDAAENFYKRAIEVDPKHANNLNNYATFLAKQRNDLDA